MRTIRDSSGNAVQYVDKLIGNAYPTVKEVKDKLPQVEKVAQALDDIDDIGGRPNGKHHGFNERKP